MPIESLALHALDPVIVWVETAIAANYFLVQALKQPQYLEAVWLLRSKETNQPLCLLAKRKSGKAHYYETTPCLHLFEDLLKREKIEVLLLSEHLVKQLPQHFQTKKMKQTSILMTRMPQKPTHHELTLDMLTPDVIPEVYPLYQHHMSGALSLQAMQDNLKHEGLGVGVQIDEKWVALAQVNTVVGKEAFLFGVLVHPDYRGQGIAHDLMRGILRQTDEKGWTIHLLTDSKIAEGLYLKHGFVRENAMIWLVLL